MWRIVLASFLGAFFGYFLAHLFIGDLEMTFGRIVICVLLIGGVVAWLTIEIIKFVKLIRERRRSNADKKK